MSQPVAHRGNTTESVEEAPKVAAIVAGLVGSPYTDVDTDATGSPTARDPRPLEPRDIIVVTPYNAQLTQVEKALADAGFPDVPVGTVDKFQGQEAAVAIVSLAASSAADAPRGIEFLLLRNRLNVAISRAKVAAYLVYSPGLLDDLPRTPEGVARLSAFARLVGVTDAPAVTAAQAGAPLGRRRSGAAERCARRSPCGSRAIDWRERREHRGRGIAEEVRDRSADGDRPGALRRLRQRLAHADRLRDGLRHPRAAAARGDRPRHERAAHGGARRASSAASASRPSRSSSSRRPSPSSWSSGSRRPASGRRPVPSSTAATEALEADDAGSVAVTAPGLLPVTTPAERHRWRAYWACVAVAALTIVDLTKVNVALPSIEQAFSASSTELQLVVSGYVLTFGLALVPAGRIGDQRSRKAMFIIGLSIFTAVERRRGARAHGLRPARRPPRAGHRRRHPDAAGDRHGAGAVPGRGARPRVRALRRDDRHRDGVRPDARRPRDPARRRRGRVALDLLDERARSASPRSSRSWCCCRLAARPPTRS